ncbi:MAG: HD domain-containing protein [Thermoflexibacter sp.]
MLNKKKIINDPVHGFISIQSELIFDIINHSYFQRLRRIRQLGLTEFVYPGAIHTRFHHALGAMHLMSVSLHTLRSKSHEITEAEYEAALIAILLHDIGHGPFSHALENTVLSNVPHEEISALIMEFLNQEFGGALDLAIRIFNNQYERKFFHQLVASQLDMDRMDYLQRDSFFTGVSEGKIGADRIIKMLEIKNDQIVVEEKGIYSIENFLNTRRLMYWQVYLHKTTVSTEQMLTQAIRRARFLAQRGTKIFASPALSLFLKNDVNLSLFKNDKTFLKAFVRLDDYDVWGAIKIWTEHEDKVLSELSKMLINRKLFRVKLENERIPLDLKKQAYEQIKSQLKLADRAVKENEIDYFLSYGVITNSAYFSDEQKILILKKNGQILDVAHASDLPNIKALTKMVKKYYLCYPKNIIL